MMPPERSSQQIGVQSQGDIEIGDNNTFTIAGRDIHLHQMPKGYLIVQLILVLPTLALLLLSFKDLLKSVPFFAFVSQYAIATPVIGGILIIGACSLFIIAYLPPSKNTKNRAHPRYYRKLLITTTLSTIISLVSSSLLVIALIRPTGCPTFLCAPPQVVTQVVTDAHGVHDENLEAYFLALQNSSFMIPGDPADYSQNDFPQLIGAIRLDEKPPVSLYRVVIGIHSLQQGRFGIIITHVGLKILQTSAVPSPLNIWNKGPTVDYHANPYSATYNGEPSGSVVPAVYTPFPLANVSLVPGEADQLDIQVNARVLASIQFRVQITYRIVNESHMHQLLLPNIFYMISSNASNWNIYQIQEGHFVATS